MLISHSSASSAGAGAFVRAQRSGSGLRSIIRNRDIVNAVLIRERRKPLVGSSAQCYARWRHACLPEEHCRVSAVLAALLVPACQHRIGTQARQCDTTASCPDLPTPQLAGAPPRHSGPRDRRAWRIVGRGVMNLSARASLELGRSHARQLLLRTRSISCSEPRRSGRFERNRPRSRNIQAFLF